MFLEIQETMTAMLLRWTLAVAAARSSMGKKREAHGTSVASWVRERTHHLNASDERGDDRHFAGVYECPDTGEAYSAAFLCTRTVMLAHPVAEKRLSEGAANMEGASNAMFKRNRLWKTVDMFDFFIEHLSWYERRFKADAANLRERALRRLGGTAFQRTSAVNPRRKTREDVVVIMPYYATAGGDSGHSALESRRAFLRLTVESLRRTFPRYTACVATEPDYEYVSNTPGLDFFDVLKRFDISKPSRLGFATLFTAQKALATDPRWAGFNFVLYTESDQILHVRDVDRLLKIAGNSAVPNHVIPHRVMPAARRVDLGPEPLDWTDHMGSKSGFRHKPGAMALSEFAQNDAKKLHRIHDVDAASCCFDRAPCSKHRSHWKRGHDSSVHLFQIAAPNGTEEETGADSVALLAGEGNFLRQSFRVCKVSPRRRDFCHGEDAAR